MTPRPRCFGVRRRNGGRHRRGRHRSRCGLVVGSLMRHFLSFSVPALPSRVRVFPVQRRLVPLPRRVHRCATRREAAPAAAVPLSAVAVAAQEKHLSARGPAARHKAQRIHRTPRAPSSAGLAPGSALRGSQRAHPHAFTRARSPGGPPSCCWAVLCLFLGRVPGGLPVLHIPRTGFQSPPDPLEFRLKLGAEVVPLRLLADDYDFMKWLDSDSRRSRNLRISATIHKQSRDAGIVDGRGPKNRQV